ncbi:MAG: hypothetical protein QM687_14405 [Ferruginibacter sp.]
MYRSLLSFILSTSVMFCTAQKNDFGIVSYTVPEGYQLIKNDNLLTYHKQDGKTGAYCKLVIYKTLPDRGSAQQNFDFFWNNLVKPSYNITETADMQPPATLKGWNLLMGTKMYNDNGVQTMLVASNFSGDNIMQNIIIQSNADIYQADIESFIASVDVTKDITQSKNAKKNNIKADEKSLNENPVSPTNYTTGSASKDIYSITVPPTWSLNNGGNSLMIEKNTTAGKRVVEFMSMIKSSGSLEKDMEHIFFEVFDGWNLHNSPNSLLFEKGDHEKGFTCQGLPYYMLSNSIIKSGAGNGDVIKGTVLLIQVGTNVAIINSTDNILGSETGMALNFLLFNLKINGVTDKNIDYKSQLIGTWAANSGLYGNSLTAVTSYTTEGKYYVLTQSSYTVGYDYYYDLIKKKQFKSSGAFSIKGNVLERTYNSGSTTKYFIRFYSSKYGNNEWGNLMGLYECAYDKNKIETVFPFHKI